MKRILSLVLVFVMMFALCAVNVNAEEYTEVDVYVNGKKLDTPQSAIILWGRTMVPARAICEALGCTVTWNGASQTVRIESPVTVVSAQINNYKLSKMDKGNSTNIQEVLLDVPPILFNDSTLLPARAIAEAFYADVQWNNDKRCVEITMEYDYIGQFNDGLAKVEKEGKVGFINLAREVVIPLSYDDAGSFSEGVAAVCKRGKYGYIDKTGGIVIEHKYLDAGPFSQGLAAVKMTDEKWYYIDLQGTLKLKGKYEVAEPFNSEGIAKVGKFISDNKVPIMVGVGCTAVGAGAAVAICRKSAVNDKGIFSQDSLAESKRKAAERAADREAKKKEKEAKKAEK